MPSTYLAFDYGASSGRAVLATLADGRLEAEEVHRFRTPLLEKGDHLYWDLNALWTETQRGLAAARARTDRLRGVSVDTWAVDYVPLGAGGTPLRNPYTYRDPRTRGRLAEALRLIPAGDLYYRTGIQLLEINTLPQLLADLAEEPGIVAATRQRMLLADYLLYRLSGIAVAERTVASTTQLMDIHTGEWAGTLHARVGLDPAVWPPIVAPGTPLGPLRGGALPAGTTPFAELPTVVAGCSHDTAAAVAAVPAAADDPSWAYVSSGTWSLVGVEREEPILTEAARRANFTNEAGLDGTVRFLKNRTGMWVLEECLRVWEEAGDRPSYETIMAEAEAAPAYSRYVDLNDPVFATRGHMPDRLRAFCREHEIAVPETRGELVRLILESLADSYRQTLGELETLTSSPVERLYVVGGGARNDLLNQWTATVCDCTVVAGPAEATVWGNALVQARALGDLPPGQTIRDVVRSSTTLRTFEPQSAAKGAGTSADRR